MVLLVLHNQRNKYRLNQKYCGRMSFYLTAYGILICLFLIDLHQRKLLHVQIAKQKLSFQLNPEKHYALHAPNAEVVMMYRLLILCFNY